MALKLLSLTLIMQQKLTDNIISCRNHRAPRRKSAGTQSVSSPSREDIAAERLEAAGRLAGWVAHEINNPLGAISGNAQLLARRLHRDVDDSETLGAYLRYLDEIQAQVERCARITAEMLNFTRPSEPEIRRIDVCEVIEETIDLIRFMHSESAINFREDADALPPVKVDRDWLARVIFEVLSNAVSASQDGPVTIEIIPKYPTLLQVRIIDSGRGIAEEVMPRVFDPFFSTLEGARGLGLTISLDMMRKMGGALKIEKTGDQGSIFIIEMPISGRQF